ncbi:MAG: hypothetical protein K0S33_561 [Bacteroidetes bacterium]|nr:hypothetical protein [Bacteroidota bacterium]
MKNLKLLSLSILVLSLFMLASCEFIGGVFKAGMGFGIFIVVAIIVVIVVLLMRAGKK